MFWSRTARTHARTHAVNLSSFICTLSRSVSLAVQYGTKLPQLPQLLKEKSVCIKKNLSVYVQACTGAESRHYRQPTQQPQPTSQGFLVRTHLVVLSIFLPFCCSEYYKYKIFGVYIYEYKPQNTSRPRIS